MKKTLTILSFLVAFPVGAALADDGCYVPMANWQPREAVARLADKNGWIVRRIKIHDGCYRVFGQDSEGQRIHVTVHPATLRVIEIEFKGERGFERRHHKRKRRGDD